MTSGYYSCRHSIWRSATKRPSSRRNGMHCARAVLLVVGALGASALVGCGRTSEPEAREIRIVMTEFRYSPDHFEVKPGERVRFVLVNQGTVEHEFVLGDQAAQDEHEREMG